MSAMKQIAVFVAVCLIAVFAISIMGCGGGEKKQQQNYEVPKT